jgi:hypothetical protein
MSIGLIQGHEKIFQSFGNIQLHYEAYPEPVGVTESVVVVASVEVITSVVVSSDEETSFWQPQMAMVGINATKRIIA